MKFKMKKNTIIAKQQIEIESYKIIFKENHAIHKDIFGMFYSVGQPLNDNKLNFNKDQLQWVFELYELTKIVTTDLNSQ